MACRDLSIWDEWYSVAKGLNNEEEKIHDNFNQNMLILNCLVYRRICLLIYTIGNKGEWLRNLADIKGVKMQGFVQKGLRPFTISCFALIHYA